MVEEEPADLNDRRRTRTVTWLDPARVLAAANAMSGIDFLRAVKSGTLSPAPMVQLVGLTPELAEEGRVIFSMLPAEFQYNTMGVVHGGAIATLVDTALGCAVLSTMPQGASHTTVELHMNFVRPVTEATGRITCEAIVLHSGRRIATAEAKVRDEAGTLYAHASTTCSVFTPSRSETH
jgi:uncharacterized protein (TIGR00369 family)